jgi:hypothetical protein
MTGFDPHTFTEQKRQQRQQEEAATKTGNGKANGPARPPLIMTSRELLAYDFPEPRFMNSRVRLREKCCVTGQLERARAVDPRLGLVVGMTPPILPTVEPNALVHGALLDHTSLICRLHTTSVGSPLLLQERCACGRIALAWHLKQTPMTVFCGGTQSRRSNVAVERCRSTLTRSKRSKMNLAMSCTKQG